MQSAVTNTAANVRSPKRPNGQTRGADATEMLSQEFAARRARLQELLRIIRTEVSREISSPRNLGRMACRRALHRLGREPLVASAIGTK